MMQNRNENKQKIRNFQIKHFNEILFEKMTNFKLCFPLVILNFRRSYVDRIYFFIVRKYINLFFRTINQTLGYIMYSIYSIFMQYWKYFYAFFCLFYFLHHIIFY